LWTNKGTEKQTQTDKNITRVYGGSCW